jgi:dynein regulatory complex protein 1
MRSFEDGIFSKIHEEIQRTLQSFDQERSLQALQIEKEVKQIAAKRQEKEQQLSRDIDTKAIEQRDTLETFRQDFAEEYMTLRTELDMKLQACQKELEDTLARNIHSLEHLDYEFRVLQDSEQENDEKLKQQSKRIVRQKDTRRALIRRYKQENEKFRRHNEQITNDYKRIAQSYRELQLRFRNVAYTDFNSFREVWNLNEKRLYDLVLKILEADRVVMEQELGKKPKPPQPDVLKRWIIGTEEFEDLTKTPQAPSAPSESGGPSKRQTFFLANKNLSEPLEHLWRLVSDEVGFLVDERVGGLIGLAPGEDIATSTQLVRIDLLLQDLGITRSDDIEQLLSYFVQDQEFLELETPGFVRPCEILEGLRRFVDAFHPNAQQNQTSLFAQITADATQNTSSEVARAILQLQQKMRKQLPTQRKFIEKKTEVVTEEMWRVWTAAFKAMQRYVKELEERAKLIEETDKLKQQNREFEMMLSRCVESENNDMLIYPPAHTVDFQTE